MNDSEVHLGVWDHRVYGGLGNKFKADSMVREMVVDIKGAKIGFRLLRTSSPRTYPETRLRYLTL